MKDLVGIIGILVLVVEIYGWLRRKWVHRILEEKKRAKQPHKPVVKKPKSKRDWRFCMEGKSKNGENKREMPLTNLVRVEGKRWAAKGYLNRRVFLFE
jgi:hypothetical protein